ncbi:MAG: hypothetical protein PHD56_07810 [Anaerostipes sp.]|nr:hypothetical protein [Anaerostipes sp.]
MSNEIKVNFENLTEDERKELMRLVEKSSEPKSKIWKPGKDEEYYFIDNFGTNDNSIWNDDSVDFRRYDIGNVFKTRKEAELAARKQKVIVELEQYAIEHNEDDINWNGTECKYKYSIAYNHGKKELIVIPNKVLEDMGQIYFTSIKIASDAINAVGLDSIEKYMFGVEVEESEKY